MYVTHKHNKYIQPGKKYNEKLYVGRSIKVIQSAIKDMDGKKIVGITDFSPTGNAITKQFELELENDSANANWEIKRVNDWNEYTSLIKQLNDDANVGAIYPVALTLRVSENETYTALEIFKWTTENSINLKWP